LLNGKPTTAVAVSEGRIVHGRKGRISYVTQVTLDGTTTTIGLDFKVTAGDRLRIIYSPRALADWSSHQKGLFYSYMIGSSTMSVTALVERKLGDTYTLGRWVVAAVGLLGSYLLYDFYRTQRRLKQIDLWRRDALKT